MRTALRTPSSTRRSLRRAAKEARAVLTRDQRRALPRPVYSAPHAPARRAPPCTPAPVYVSTTSHVLPTSEGEVRTYAIIGARYWLGEPGKGEQITLTTHARAPILVAEQAAKLYDARLALLAQLVQQLLQLTGLDLSVRIRETTQFLEIWHVDPEPDPNRNATRARLAAWEHGYETDEHPGLVRGRLNRDDSAADNLQRLAVEVTQKLGGSVSALPITRTERVPQKAHSIELRLLEYLAQQADEGAMCEQAEHALGLPHRTISARLADLARHGLVSPSPRTRRTTRCRAARVMILTPSGRIEVQERLAALEQGRRWVRRQGA